MSILWTLWTLLLLGTAVPAWAGVSGPADLTQVGARTTFNYATALDVADYCNGQDTLNDPACINTWVGDAFTQGRHLYASPGTYRYTSDTEMFSGFYLRCAHPLRNVFLRTGSGTQVLLLAQGQAPPSPGMT